MKQAGKRMSTETMVLGAVLTAAVIVLQTVAVVTRLLGVFSLNLSLIPIVIGAALCGTGVSTWLGFVSGIAILLSGDAAPFLAVNVPGTIITVIAKGIACGFFAGFVYNLLKKKNRYIATVFSAIACPVANTGVFLVGCGIFFLDTISAWAGGGNVAQYVIVGLVGVNFLLELGSNILLSPIVVRLIDIKNKK